MNPLLINQINATAHEHYRHGRLDRAREAFEMLCHHEPSSPQHWMMLGLVFRRQKVHWRAVHALKRAVELDRQDRKAQVLLGEALCTIGQPRQGIALLRKAFEEGLDQSAPPSQQDPLTKRAGAVLEAIQMGLNLWRFQPR